MFRPVIPNVVMCYLTLKFRNQNKELSRYVSPTASHAQPVSFFSLPPVRNVSSTQMPTLFLFCFCYCFCASFGNWNVIWKFKQQFKFTLCAILCSTFTRLLSRSLFLFLSLFHFSSICLFHSVEFCSHLSNKTTKKAIFEPAKNIFSRNSQSESPSKRKRKQLCLSLRNKWAKS